MIRLDNICNIPTCSSDGKAEEADRGWAGYVPVLIMNKLLFIDCKYSLLASYKEPHIIHKLK